MTPSRHAARAGERTRVGALRGYAAILGVAVVLVIAYGAFTQPPLPADAAEDGGAIREQGAALFLQNCASCHGPAGQGAAAGPPLLTARRGGRRLLPADGADAARRARPAAAAPGAALRHEADPGARGVRRQLRRRPRDPAGDDGRRPPSRLGAVHGELRRVPRGERRRATRSVAGSRRRPRHEAEPLEIAEAMIVGPGRHAALRVRPARPDAIVAYVRFLRNSPSPGGVPIGGFGPVSEGFVAVVIGLSLFVALARSGRPSTARPTTRTPAWSGTE